MKFPASVAAAVDVAVTASAAAAGVAFRFICDVCYVKPIRAPHRDQARPG